MAKAKIGDIFEINTPSGLAYVQYTHRGATMGELVRVLPGLFSTRPTDLSGLAKQRELYFVFYTLTYALRNNEIVLVSHEDVPEWARRPPQMRWPGGRDDAGRVTGWKVFNAGEPLTVELHQRTPVIRELSPDQEKLSIHQLWSHPVMVKQLARGWLPERAEEIRIRDARAAGERGSGPTTTESHQEPIRHYLYFAKQRSAEEVGELLKAQGFSVTLRRSADGDNWLTLATKSPPKTGEQIDIIREQMEGLAVQFGGEYDGWEAAINSDGDLDRKNIN